MRRLVLVDSGPLVALFDRSDHEHVAARAMLASLERAELATTEAVVTECSYLLERAELQAALQAWLALGRVRVEPVLVEDRAPLADLLRRYERLPMDYADGTLVRLATRLRTLAVWTLDRRDFSVYRVGRRAFEILGTKPKH